MNKKLELDLNAIDKGIEKVFSEEKNSHPRYNPLALTTEYPDFNKAMLASARQKSIKTLISGK